MKAYDLFVPFRDNRCIPYNRERFDAFKADLLAAYGGYSVERSTWDGAWRDPKTGLVHMDENQLVRIIGDTTDPAVNAFFAHFPDQLCVAVTCGGEAWLIDNPNG